MDTEEEVGFYKGFVPNSALAMSTFHHRMIGSSQRHSDDPKELHRPHHEFMDDDQLKAKVERDIGLMRTVKKPSDGGKREQYEQIRDEFILPDLRYLVGIGRLPEGIDVAALTAEFAIPD
jgi:hypothetical protein